MNNRNENTGKLGQVTHSRTPEAHIRSRSFVQASEAAWKGLLLLLPWTKDDQSLLLC